ncbi:MAG: FHA domain-containing protein [Lachnospiraceae bacterium]|nr:FHA domain-containing protein [Lachnospiraceae bacterium]
MDLKAYWNTRTIFRKIILIGLTLHFLGCFLLPFAEMHKMTSSLSQLASAWGLADLPEKLTVFSLSRIMSEMGSEDSIFYMLIIVTDICLLAIQIIGKKRASYVITFLIWHVNLLFTSIASQAAQDVTGYVDKPFPTLLMVVFLGGAVYLASIAGIFLENKARAKLAARGASGQTSSVGSSIDTEKLKEQAGNLADTGAAVAKKTAKMAVKGIFKASEAAKDFVESAKNESGVSSAPKSAPTPAPALKQQPAAHKNQTAIPKSGTITGVKGMYAGATIDIVPGEFVIIGRSAEKANLVINNDLVGRQHCIIQYDGNTGNYIVTDCSTNGTFLGNGSRLVNQKPTTVAPGTVIVIVNKENTFQLG